MWHCPRYKNREFRLYGDEKLCAEFYTGSGFASHYGADVGLREADDPAVCAVCLRVQHMFLLPVDFFRRGQRLSLTLA